MAPSHSSGPWRSRSRNGSLMVCDLVCVEGCRKGRQLYSPHALRRAAPPIICAGTHARQPTAENYHGGPRRGIEPRRSQRLQRKEERGENQDGTQSEGTGRQRGRREGRREGRKVTGLVNIAVFAVL